MGRAPPDRPPPRPGGRSTGAAGIGLAAIAAAIAATLPVTREHEGKRNVGYADRIARRPVPTICYGHTGPEVVVGRRLDDQSCEALLEGDLAKHARGVARCVPGIAGNPYLLGAATDLAFNVGIAAFCGSTAARRFNAGDLKGGCDALGPSFHVETSVGGRIVTRRAQGFVRSGGRVRAGLVRRREKDRALCERGLASR
jgi:lysozyme